MIPGELCMLQLDEPVTLLVCRANGAQAWSVAEELREAALRASTPRAQLRLKHADDDMLLSDESELQRRRRLSAPLAGAATSRTAFLLYMNEDLFCDGGTQAKGSVAYFVHKFLKLRVSSSTHSRVTHFCACPVIMRTNSHF